MTESELIHAIGVLVTSNYPARSHKVDAAFVFGHAQSNWEDDGRNTGLLNLAAELRGFNLVQYVVVPGHEANATVSGKPVSTTYPGGKLWQTKLKELGVVDDRVLLTSGTTPPHTRGEGDDFIALAKAEDKAWKRAVIITQPYHVLRAMRGLLVSMRDLQYPMLILPVIPSHVEWTKPVFGSQGTEQLPRYEHIAAEWKKCHEYEAEGYIASLAELYEYLLATLKAWHANLT